jgi:glycosyltransferase involved in cell wall biosynthesis
MGAMRIAMVSEHASPLAALGGVDAGGQNVHVHALACALGRAGHQVVVYTRRDDRDLPRRVRIEPRVEVVHAPAGPPAPIPKDDLLPHMPALGEWLAAEWRRTRPDVVHAHFWMSGLAALHAARPLGIPVLLTYHALGAVKRAQQGVKDTSPRARIDAERMLARAVDRVVATANEEVFALLRMGASRDRISLVPCGVDLSCFCPGGRRERRGVRPRVVVVSRLVERKGIGNVVEALTRLPDVELVVGGGPDRDGRARDPDLRRLAALAAELGVADRVELRGRVARADVPALLRSADAVVCTPWYEPFGLVALEAMACGVPVVATAVGGLVDTVVDGRTGFHVPPRDPGAIAAAVSALLADPARARQLGAAGCVRARARYGWPTIAEETARAYALTKHEAARPVGRLAAAGPDPVPRRTR